MRNSTFYLHVLLNPILYITHPILSLPKTGRSDANSVYTLFVHPVFACRSELAGSNAYDFDFVSAEDHTICHSNARSDILVQTAAAVAFLLVPLSSAGGMGRSDMCRTVLDTAFFFLVGE